MTEIKYPLAKETINKSDIDILVDWLKTYPKLTQGKLVKEFEKLWAEYIGTRYAVFVNSGSSANLLMIYALVALNQLKPGDKVIVPAVGWGTTIAPIMQFGLIPVIMDVGKSDFGLDPASVEQTLKKDKKIKAVLCVHALGVPCYVATLREVCKNNGCYFLEDACAALGSETWPNKRVGSLGDMSSFSFFFGHQLSTIEGGMINTNDDGLYDVLMMARSHGWLKDTRKEFREGSLAFHKIDKFHEPFTFMIPGFNLRGTDLQARLGIEQVKRADYCFNRRHENHLRYCLNLQPYKNKLMMQDTLAARISSISFGAVCKNPNDRRTVVEALVKNGIETRLYSAGNLAEHPFVKCSKAEVDCGLIVANQIHNGGFFLPNYPELTLDEVDFICNVVKEALDDNAK